METGEFTTPEGNKLRYYCTGAGNRTFVLLHAQGTSSESYFEVAKQLGKTAKVILIDCYGHGGSSHNAELYQLDEIGDDIHPRYIGGSADNILWQKYLEPLLTSSSCPCVHFTGVQKEPVRAIDWAWQLCAREEEGYEFGIRDQLSQVVLFLAQNLAFATKKPSAKTLRDGERMKRMLQYIQEHYTEEIFLSQIAESAHIGESECLRCFRSMIGCSPLQYVKQLRLQKAAELLLSTNLKISEIGMQCGFQEMSYFAKEFRAMKGCTPHDFQNRR